MCRSSAIVGSAPGRCTLSATAVPSWSVARYTCPSDAAATGASSTDAKHTCRGAFSSASTIANASAVGNGGTLSCSCVSSARYSAGSRSERDESACPALMIAGPRLEITSRSSAARFG
eukprot:2851913-Prymnesium_polylepis.1